MLLAPLTTLALLTAAILATPDAGARVPGTRLRLGMSEKELQAAGEFIEVNAHDLPGATARRGELRFFGIVTQATVYVRDGRLAQARFEAADVPPHSADYVEDQLRRQRLWRECSTFEPGHHVCDWLGAVKVHLEVGKGRLAARVGPAGPGPAENPSEPTTAAPPPGVETRAASAQAGASIDSSRSASGPPAVAPRPGPAPPGIVAGAVPSPTAIAILPDTFTISLMTRNSVSDWPRVISSPALEYPQAARRESVQGIVWVLALVGANGAPEIVQVDRGIKELNAAAVSCIQHSRFAPCQRSGSPCRFWVRIAVRFTLY